MSGDTAVPEKSGNFPFLGSGTEVTPRKLTSFRELPVMGREQHRVRTYRKQVARGVGSKVVVEP